MRSFRYTFLALIIFLIFVFNIERVDIGVKDVINIQTFVYILLISIIIITIAFRTLATINIKISYTVWLTVYVVLKYLLNPDGFIFLGGVNTYIAITEITFVFGSITLSHQLAIQLKDIEEAVKNFIFSDKSNRILQDNKIEEDIDREMYRSRRLNHPVSVIMIEPSEHTDEVVVNRTVQDIYKSLMRHYIVISLARGMDTLLRRTDLLIEQFKQGRIILFSSETSGDEAAILVERIKENVKEVLDLRINTGIASFPEDALTYDELVSQAESSLELDRSSIEPIQRGTQSPEK